MNTLEAIYNRRSCRSYTDELVTEDEINTVLRAAFSAPTAVNTQSWEYIVITGEEVLDKIKDKDLWICDCSAAIENMLLAATDIGLGNLWIGLFLIKSRMVTLKNS